MEHSHQLLISLSFGLTSGVITTLGLLTGLFAGTHSRTVVIGGILTIALADSLSDALGLHVAEEAEGIHTTKELWETAIFTFLTKFVVALTFLTPVLFLPLSTAVVVSIAWGLFLICSFSVLIARETEAKFRDVALEHIVATLAVILATYCLGNWVATTLG